MFREVNLPVSGVMNLYVKQNGREEGNEDDYIILSPEDDYLDVSSYLYETYMLNYPMRVVHPGRRMRRRYAGSVA